MLDLNDSLHMFALTYVFEPRINRHLQVFAEGWDDHPLRTERNLTPKQLWIYGQNFYHEEDECTEDYGIDWDGPFPSRRISGCASDGGGVEIPEIHVQLSSIEREQLKETINPLAPSSSFGCDIYLQTVQLLKQFYH